MAWPEVLSSGLYQLELERAGLVPLVPQETEQTLISALIEAVKQRKVTQAMRSSAIKSGKMLFANGAGAVILGCTELPLVLSQDDFEAPIVDATLSLAHAVVGLAQAHQPASGGGEKDPE
jgi:aspartate racemase